MSKGVKKKGFTLVELVVVLAIFGLLASITGLGLYSWTRYSINKENNENARTIFLAAQESLTHMQASGTLNEFADSFITEENRTPVASISPEINPNFSARLYTIFYTPGSLESKALNTNEEVRKMLSPYLEGTDVFNHAFAIEFDPQDGVVYSVFYSKKADSLEYEADGNTKESGVVGITKRDSGTLKDRLLGYYSADLTAAKPTQIPVVLFETTDVPETDTELLVNKEELYFRIPTTGSNINKTKLNYYFYQIYIYAPDTSNHQSDPIVRLELNGSSLPANGKTDFIDYKAYYYKNGQDNSSSKTIKLKTTVRDEDIKICFDSIDTNALEKLFNLSDFKLSFENGNGKDFAIFGYDNKFDKTLSIFNLLQGVDIEGRNSGDGKIDFRNIYCRGYIYNSNSNDKNLLYDTTISNTEDILFSKSVIDDNKCEIEIANMRHLFNISYIEQLNKTSIINSIYYTQVDNFSYKQEFIFDSDNTSDASKLSVSKSFPVLEVLSSKSTYDGNEKVISNLQLNSDMVSSELSRSSDYLKRNTGIFSTNYGMIKNVQLIEANLISKIDDHGTDFTNRNVNPAYGSGIIAGVNEGTIDNCKVSGTISGYVNTGGLVGINKKTIINCESSVLIVPQNEKSYNFGGLVGINTGDNAIIKDNTYKADNPVTLSMLEQENNPFKDDLKGYHIGGIVGNLTNKSKLENCKTVSTNEGYIIGYGSVGGIVGICDSTASITSTYLNGERGIYNEANVIGVDCVGGVIANIAISNNISKVFANLENRGAIVVMTVTGPGGEPVGSYGGGITAYLPENTTLNNSLCNISIDYEETENISIKEQLLIKYSNGSIVGGLVGQQRGTIISDSIVEHKVLVGGGDNVGGLVGDNDINSNAIPILKKQKISAGIIIGNDYVGGLIGYNTKVISDDSNINHTINRIIGDDYVGGIAGYNIKEYKDKYNNNTNVSISQQQISVESITGDTFVGGLVGLNEGTISNYNDAENSIESVVGNSYVGALVGKNEPEAKISQNYISNITIKANGSFVGGLAGENQGEITLYNRKMINNIKINNEATENNQYTGGLAGSNSGLITNFNIASANIVSKGSYTGGAIGFNALNGSVTNIGNITTAIVEGTSYVGGLAGENEGDISTFTISSGKIHASGEYSGGLCGKNNGTIKNSGIVINKLEVSGTNYVGGLAGYNSKYRSTESEEYNTEPNIYCNTVNGKVAGNGNYVGGLAGYNQGYIKSDSVAEVTVEVNNNNAESSYTGGFIGYNSVDSKLGVFFAKNVKVVSSGGYTGGFAGYNDGLFDFNGTGFNHILTVIGSGNYTGGMVGYNDSNAFIKYAVLSEESSVEGNDYVGWLFGYNKGKTKVYNTVDCSVNVKGANYVGGLSGGDESLENNYKVVNGSVLASGNYVGGIFGSYNEQATSEYMTYIRDVNVSGKNYVGGCFGTIDEDSNPKLMIKADNIQVSGDNFVSGLVPVLNANQEIGKYFEQNEQIEFNSISIDITNVDVQDGQAGIVTALNNGYIHEVDIKNSTITTADNCKVGIVSALNNRRSDEIAESNNGKIDNVLVEKNLIKYTNNNCVVGFVAGVNNGIIQNSKVFDNNFELIGNQVLSRSISTSYLGEITGINGSTEVLDANKMASVQNCDVNNLVSSENTRDIELTGINLGKMQNIRLVNSSDTNIISSIRNQYNTISNQDSPSIVKPERDGENVLFVFNNLIDNSVLKIFGIKLIDGIVTSREKILDTSLEVTAELTCNAGTCNYYYNNAKHYNGFELYAKNPIAIENNNIQKLPSEVGKTYFFDVPLPEVEMEISQKQDNNLVIKYVPLNENLKNYISEYRLHYKIDNGDIHTLTFNNENEIELLDLIGESVVFSVTAKPNDESYFYSESPIKWSEPYEIVNVNVLSEMSINEETENLTNRSLEDIEASTDSGTAENEADDENN